MNKYVGFYKSKQFECESDTSYHAQQKMAEEHHVKHGYDITVLLANKNGEQVIHNGNELP